MARKRQTRTVKGLNQQVFVPKPIAITTDATLALFLANAPTGEVGVYDASDALHTNAIVAGESLYVVQKKSDGSIKRSTLVKFSDCTFSRKTYVAPVKATGSLGWSGTAGALNLAAAPSNGALYELGIIETTEGYQPFPTWNYEYQAKPGDVEMDVIQALVKQINDADNLVYKQNQPLVTAKAKADATYGNYAIGAGGTLTVTNGSTSVVTAVGTINFVIGDFVAFDAAATPTDAVGDIYKIVGNPDANTWTLNRPYTGATQTFIEAEAEGTRVKSVTTIVKTGIVFTAINDQEHFNIIARQGLQYATIANLATYTRGNGIYEQINDLELEGNTFDGNTAGNTQFGNEAYGNPDRFAVVNGEAETYDLFHIEAKQDSSLISPIQGKMKLNIIIAAPKSAGGLSASLNTLFGL